MSHLESYGAKDAYAVEKLHVQTCLEYQFYDRSDKLDVQCKNIP